MKLEFANTDKKINSTAIVSSYPLSLTGAKFKEECNLTFPVFMIGTNSISYTSYNYVKVTFDNNQIKYYFINSFELGTNNCWYINCTMDVLATFKSSILAKSLYVLRSASDYDTNVVDTTYPTTSDFKHVYSENIGNITVYDRGSIAQTTITPNNYFNKQYDTGYFYLKILQGGTSGVAGTTLYVMDDIGFKSFIANIFNIDYTGEFEDTITGVARGVANVFQYITECYWLPVINPGLTLSNRTINLGGYPVNCPSCAVEVVCKGITVTFSMTLPESHPQVSRGKYLNASPYSTRILKFYPFGVYDLSIPAISDTAGSIYVILEIDEFTGETLIQIENNSELASEQCVYITDTKNYKVDIPISQASLSLVGAIGATLNNWSSIEKGAYGNVATIGEREFMKVLTQGPMSYIESKMGEAFRSATGTPEIGQLLQGAGTEIHTNGTLGAILPFSKKPRIECEYCYITEEDLDHNGRPLCKTKQLSSLSGYCLCRDNDIGITGASQDQLNMIKNFLTGGFFIE